MNGYIRQILMSGAVIEAWAGGPCILTGQRCPCWAVKRPDGTGFQSRGLSIAGTTSEVAHTAMSIAKELVEIAS